MMQEPAARPYLKNILALETHPRTEPAWSDPRSAKIAGKK